MTRVFLSAAVLGVGALASSAPVARTAPAPGAHKPFTVVEATIPEMQAAMKAGRLTSRQIVEQYLLRLATYEDTLHAALTVNPRALAEADQRDRERARGHILGPLHGIPIALKDNILTMDMPTTGGALAFDGLRPPYEATLAKNLRAAGAIIIAKTGMTELANYIAGPPTPMPGDYNAIGGFGMNPYDPRRDPRDLTADGRPVMQTGGSSSGIGTSASFWAGNVGSETSGSILSPSNQTMLAGVKPTVGRISRYGVIPIAADQDTAGPMAKHVVDVAIMLGVLESAAPDPNDPATTTCTPPAGHDYTALLKTDALKGARIGVPRAFFYDAMPAANGASSGARPRGGLSPEEARSMADAIAVLKQSGAVLVDPADIPSVVDPDPANNFLEWGSCNGDDWKTTPATCSIVLNYGMKRDFNNWLASLGAAAPVATLADLRKWNLAHQRAGSIKYGQSKLDDSDAMDLDRDRARYESDRAKDVRLSATHGIDAVMTAQRLDALLFPGARGAAIAAKPGYPTVIVPFGLVPNAPTPPLPADFQPKLQPFGVSFTGMACSEPRLLAMAYAFEQATKRRVPPPNLP